MFGVAIGDDLDAAVGQETARVEKVFEISERAMLAGSG